MKTSVKYFGLAVEP